MHLHKPQIKHEKKNTPTQCEDLPAWSKSVLGKHLIIKVMEKNINILMCANKGWAIWPLKCTFVFLSQNFVLISLKYIPQENFPLYG